MCSSITLNPMATLRSAASTNACLIAERPAPSSSAGVGHGPPAEIADGATVSHLPGGNSAASASVLSGAPGRSPKGGRAEALRPAWASWMPGTHPCARMKSTVGLIAAACSSDQMPRQRGVMRPRGSTAVASVNTRPTLPRAKVLRCAKSHGPAMPSTALYMHSGESATRLGSVTPRIVRGWNSFGVDAMMPQGRYTDTRTDPHKDGRRRVLRRSIRAAGCGSSSTKRSQREHDMDQS